MPMYSNLLKFTIAFCAQNTILFTMKKILVLGLILLSITQLGYAHAPKDKTKGIREILLVKFKSSTTAKEIAGIDSLIMEMREKVKPIKKLEWGKRIDENNATSAYDYCLMLEFKNETDKETYRVHPLHYKLLGRLIPLSEKTLKFTYLINK